MFDADPLAERGGELPEGELLARTEKSLRLIKEYESKVKKDDDEYVVAYEEFMRVDESRKELLVKIEQCGAEIEELRAAIKAAEEKYEFYRPWRLLPVKPGRLGETDIPYPELIINPYDEEFRCSRGGRRRLAYAWPRP